MLQKVIRRGKGETLANEVSVSAASILRVNEASASGHGYNSDTAWRLLVQLIRNIASRINLVR